MEPQVENQTGQAVTDARWILSILTGLGVNDFVYCPGSRCAPFAYALAEMETTQPGVRVHTKIDERSAAFYALGLSRGNSSLTGTPTPVALIMTSGTAVGHALPAVMEAHHSGIPLVVVSADRPWEMREVGASQTSRQTGIFANFVRRTLDLPAGLNLPTLLPVKTADPELAHYRAQEALQTSGVRQLRNQLRHLAHAWQTTHANPGPVHLNVGLRDPLTPQIAGDPLAWQEIQYQLSDDSYLYATPETPATDTAAYISADAPTILVVGADAPALPTATLPAETQPTETQPTETLPAEVWRYWANQGYVIIAEPGSTAFSQGVAQPYQQQLVNQLGAEAEQIIVFGRPTLSRPLTRLVNSPDHDVIIVSAHADYPDLTANAALVLPRLEQLPEQGERGKTYATKWAEAVEKLHAHYQQQPLPDGLTAAKITWDTLGENTLVAGASNAIRYLDLIADNRQPHGRIYTNRGQAGIDGTIAFARGLHFARHADGAERTRVLLGDLTFLHDASSLLNAVGEPAPNLDIIVLDDQGGRIFASLEHGETQYADLYERFFGMGQTVDYQALATAYGWKYQLVAGLQTPQAQQELTTALTTPTTGGRIIHITCDHTQIREQIKVLF